MSTELPVLEVGSYLVYASRYERKLYKVVRETKAQWATKEVDLSYELGELQERLSLRETMLHKDGLFLVGRHPYSMKPISPHEMGLYKLRFMLRELQTPTSHVRALSRHLHTLSPKELEGVEEAVKLILSTGQTLGNLFMEKVNEHKS